MSWKMEVQVDGKWSGNGIAFATEWEAQQAGLDLLARWFVPTDSRAVESDEPVNYEIVDGKQRKIPACEDCGKTGARLSFRQGDGMICDECGEKALAAENYHGTIPPYDLPPDDEDPEELEPAGDDEHPF